jgi:transcription initiation factor IIE alpha subunit
VTITAKLSRRLYEQFGDADAEELVNLLNNVDNNSRASLRELNESNFARFDAKMEQRFAEFRVEMHALRSDLIKWMFIFFTGSALANILLR